MIFLYLCLIIGISIFEIKGLRKKGCKKDIFVFIGSMVLVFVFGFLYFLDNYHPSISSYILDFFNVER